jgi:hypothetical protein
VTHGGFQVRGRNNVGDDVFPVPAGEGFIVGAFAEKFFSDLARAPVAQLDPVSWSDRAFRNAKRQYLALSSKVWLSAEVPIFGAERWNKNRNLPNGKFIAHTQSSKLRPFLGPDARKLLLCRMTVAISFSLYGLGEITEARTRQSELFTPNPQTSFSNSDT